MFKFECLFWGFLSLSLPHSFFTTPSLAFSSNFFFFSSSSFHLSLSIHPSIYLSISLWNFLRLNIFDIQNPALEVSLNPSCTAHFPSPQVSSPLKEKESTFLSLSRSLSIPIRKLPPLLSNSISRISFWFLLPFSLK